MSNSVFTRFGGLSLPVTEYDTEDSLSSLDPARDRMLAWFAAAINAEFSDSWTEAVNALPGTHPLFGTTPAQDTYPGEPTRKALTERKCSFPLLALHRTGTGVIEPFSIEEDRLTQSWHLHHILGPLDIEGQRRILDIGQAIGKMLAASIRKFGHPSHESGANQIEACGLKDLKITAIDGPGPARFDDGDDSVFWATRYTLTTVENSEPLTEQMGWFEGADLSVDVGGPEIIPDLVEASW